MAKYLVHTSDGQVTVEAEQSSLIGQGLLAFFDGSGDEQNLVACWIPGRWSSFQKLLDSKPLQN